MTIAYKEEVRALTVWCQDNTISLNIRKRNKLIGDYRKRSAEPAPIHIDGAVVEQVTSFKFLGVHIPTKLLWSTLTNKVVKRARYAPPT